MGGVSSARDVMEMMLAGATAVEVGAANLINPLVCKEIVEELPSLLESYNVQDLKEIIYLNYNTIYKNYIKYYSFLFI